MADFSATLLDQARGLAGPEGFAVVCAVLYLVLAIRQNIACWLFAGLSTALYVYLYFAAQLYMESALNIFYFAMAIYGWYMWRGGSKATESALPVTTWPLRVHVSALVAIAILSGVSGFLLDTRTDAAYPYVDSATTWSAIWATFLVTRKVFENWWYWLVIDVVSVYIFWSRELELTAVLFAIYVVMIPFGLLSWHRSMRESAA